MNWIQKSIISIFGAGFLGSCFLLSSNISNKPIPVSPPPISKTEKYTDDKTEVDDEKFIYAMKAVIKHEGGYSDSKHDSGGPTKYGVSLRYLKIENIDINGDGIISKDDVIHLTKTEADKIYYKEWYKKNRYNEIENKDILTDIMDFSINVGATQCHKILKRAINKLINEPIEVDGYFDTNTIDIVNLIEPIVLKDSLNKEQEWFYRSLVKKNPDLNVFLSGWLRRSAD